MRAGLLENSGYTDERVLPESRPKICIVNAASFTFRTLCHGLTRDLERRGYEVHAVLGDAEYTEFPSELFGNVNVHYISMERMPNPLKDLASLWRLLKFFSRNRFEIIHVSTPKATLLGNLAGFLTRNGPRIFVYRRRVYELMSERKRRVYIEFDRLMVKLSAFVVPISVGIREQLIADRVCGPDKIRMAGGGSSNGIDAERYSRRPSVIAEGRAIKQAAGIPPNAPVVLFLGRIVGEKGVAELPGVFERVHAKFPDAHFIVTGPTDKRDPVPVAVTDYFASKPYVHEFTFAERPEVFYGLADVFAFPSYFEGYGNVILEAAAMECPTVGFNVPGVCEAIVDSKTGYLVPIHDQAAMAERICVLLGNDDERSRMAKACRQRILSQFDQQVIWDELNLIFDEAKMKVGKS